AATPEAASGPEPVATGDLRCPAPVRDGLSGPDIIGLRPGMTADEALATARCALGADAEVSTANRWLDRLDTQAWNSAPRPSPCARASIGPATSAANGRSARAG